MTVDLDVLKQALEDHYDWEWWQVAKVVGELEDAQARIRVLEHVITEHDNGLDSVGCYTLWDVVRRELNESHS